MSSNDEPLDDPDRVRMFDEASGFIAENYPRALRLFYSKCESEGFTPDQCMSLVGKYFEMILTNTAMSRSDQPDEMEIEDDGDESDSDSDERWKI
jgi:hypothetical protein